MVSNRLLQYKAAPMSSSLTSSPFLTSQRENIIELLGTSANPQFFALDFPELQCGQYAIFSTELSADGSPLTPDNQYYLDSEDGNTPWQMFDSFKEARTGAIETVVANPNHQCAIFDASRQHVHTIRNGQPIPLEVLLARQPKSPKNWWQVWK
jgi:hypothetical protein